MYKTNIQQYDSNLTKYRSHRKPTNAREWFLSLPPAVCAGTRHAAAFKNTICHFATSERKGCIHSPALSLNFCIYSFGDMPNCSLKELEKWDRLLNPTE